MTVAELLRVAHVGRQRARNLGSIDIARLAQLLHGVSSKDWARGADLTLTVSRDATSLELIGNGILFSADTLDLMACHTGNLLAEMAADQCQLVGDLAVIDDHERHVILLEWNDTRDDDVDERFFHELVEQVADETPHKPAGRLL